MMITRSSFAAAALLLALLAFTGVANATTTAPGNLAATPGVTPIPPGPTTSLPDYAGAPAQANPLGDNGVPQNPLLAPNGFNSCHLDPWMSDTANVDGPLGVMPATNTSTFGGARKTPLNDEYGPPWIFICITPMFDSHGHLITACFAPTESTVVLADPVTLEVLSDYKLAVPSGNVYGNTGRQAVMRSTGGSYSFLDAQDQLTIVSGGKQIVTLKEAGTVDNPELQLVHTYDLSTIIPEDYNDVAGVMLDWQNRIWFTTAASQNTVAKVGIINPATWSDANPNPSLFALPAGELIRNTFAVAKSGDDRASAYVVSSENMYRFDAGADDVITNTWTAPYDTIGTTKPGQYELGSGTSPTLLGDGDYVAITDNAEPMKVVVYRTGDNVDPADRVVCEVPVFVDQPGQALSNSLIGFRRSLIATNNYYYLWDWTTGTTVDASAPGFARIDVDADGKGCTTIWSKTEVATTTSPRLSTTNGLIYTVAREYDPDALETDGSQGLFVYYWTALDYETGEQVWKKMAGTGDEFDSFYPALAIGPDKALYVGAYGGFMRLSDTAPRVWMAEVAKE